MFLVGRVHVWSISWMCTGNKGPSASDKAWIVTGSHSFYTTEGWDFLQRRAE